MSVTQMSDAKRAAIIKAAVDRAVAELLARPQIQPLTEGVPAFHCEVVGVAIDEVMKKLWPKETKQESALSDIFDENWNDIWAAIRESAFLVGAAYGWRLAGGK